MLNATQYEFDVDCNSPDGTVVFEAAFILEDVNNVAFVAARFIGGLSPYFLINGVTEFVINNENTGFGSVIPLTISLTQPLNCNLEPSVWIVQLQAIASDYLENLCEDTSDVIIYKGSSKTLLFTCVMYVQWNVD